MMASFHIVVGY